LVYPEEAKRNELSANIEATLFINEEGKVAEITTGESYKIFRNEIKRVLKTMPDWKPATYGERNIPAVVHLNVDFNIRRADQVKVSFNDNQVSLVNSPGNTYLVYGQTEGTAKNASKQWFEKTGWYNCARVVKTSGALADVIIRSDAKTDVKLVLKNHNSIISGQDYVGYSRFKNLPVNTDVYIVAVHRDKGQLSYAVQPLKLEKQTVVSLDFKKGEEADVVKAYKKLKVAG
jgi:hypothetical protein